MAAPRHSPGWGGLPGIRRNRRAGRREALRGVRQGGGVQLPRQLRHRDRCRCPARARSVRRTDWHRTACPRRSSPRQVPETGRKQAGIRHADCGAFMRFFMRFLLIVPDFHGFVKRFGRKFRKVVDVAYCKEAEKRYIIAGESRRARRHPCMQYAADGAPLSRPADRQISPVRHDGTAFSCSGFTWSKKLFCKHIPSARDCATDCPSRWAT